MSFSHVGSTSALYHGHGFKYIVLEMVPQTSIATHGIEATAGLRGVPALPQIPEEVGQP